MQSKQILIYIIYDQTLEHLNSVIKNKIAIPMIKLLIYIYIYIVDIYGSLGELMLDQIFRYN